MAVKYFQNGFLSLSGKAILKLTDISLDLQVDSDELSSFDNFPWKEYASTGMGWTASASGIMTDDATELSKWSTEVGNITGATNGFLLLESVKSGLEFNFIIKIDSTNYQTGNCILNSISVSGALGTKMTYSLSITGSGALTKSVS